MAFSSSDRINGNSSIINNTKTSFTQNHECMYTTPINFSINCICTTYLFSFAAKWKFRISITDLTHNVRTFVASFITHRLYEISMVIVFMHRNRSLYILNVNRLRRFCWILPVYNIHTHLKDDLLQILCTLTPYFINSLYSV